MEFVTSAARLQEPVASDPFHEWSLPDGTPWTRFHRTESGYLLRFPELADFVVSRDGRSVQCWPTPGISEATIQQLYLNQVLPLAQSKHGKLVFHASAVEIGDYGVAFLGESGKGKSTLAASFATNGFRFLTDDGLVIESSSAGARILPSHPSIRLWEDSQEALIRIGSQVAPAVQFTSKARFLAGGGLDFCQEARALRRVYFLGDAAAETIRVTKMSPSESMIEMVKHSFLLDIGEKTMLAEQFLELSGLVKQPIFFKLDYPRNFDKLKAVRDAIVLHSSNRGEA